MLLLTINYKLLLWYSMYNAGDGLDYSSVYWTSLVCLSVQGDKHFSRGQAVWFVTSDPAHCHGWGWSLSVSCGSVDSSPLFWTLSPEASNQSVKMFLCKPVTPSTKLKLYWPVRWWQRTGHQHRPARTVGPAGSRSSSQPTCLYYTVLTKSLCLTTPFLYSNGETLLV